MAPSEPERKPAVRLQRLRLRHGWPQQELAHRAGLSRPEVSAIETGRVVPSVRAALALARALTTSVEALFGQVMGATEWAWQPPSFPCRVWLAEVGARRLAFPCETGFNAMLPHDVVVDSAEPPDFVSVPPTLVVAGCDPAAGLLAEVLRESGVRVLVLIRSSTQALELLRAGQVHVAGVHLADRRGGSNQHAVRQHLGAGYRLLRWATWETGVAIAPDATSRFVDPRSLDPRQLGQLRWVGREVGSGARRSLEALFAGATPRFELIAHDHREVAQAIRLGAADAGVCIRLVADDAGLDFLRVRQEPYDLCFAAALEADPSLDALRSALIHTRLKRLLGEIPGYDAKACGLQTSVG